MVNLIKSDFKRILKDKLFMVMCILGGVFALITPLLYRLLFWDIDPTLEMFSADYVSAKAQFFDAFSLANNFGLIVPVLIAIIICKDFSFGTVRNKIISGNSRTSIFLSMFTVCFVTLWLMILIHALLTLGISLMFFEYQSKSFTLSDFWYFLQSVAFEMLVYLFIAALVSWLCVAMKNVGLAIVMYVAFVLVLTMVAGILQISMMVLEFEEGTETTLKILDFFQRINVVNSYTIIGKGLSYELKDTLCLILSPAIGTLAFLGFGILKFNKKDLK